MDKIISPEQAATISSQLQENNKNVVLIGGCFDILHIGHIRFLNQAKERGEILIVLLENDETIKEKKGKNRPFNTQQDRATVLAALSMVDYVIMLPSMKNDQSYDEVVKNVKPAIIATTAGDPNRQHKERSAKLVNATVVDVLEPIYNQSTTKLVKVLKEI